MAATWNSTVFVFKGEDGHDYVSAALPSGVIDASRIQLFQASGPYMPIGWPKPQKVDNAEEWMRDLQTKGFSFRSTTFQ